MEAGLINYREDRCMSGESMFKTEASLMIYRHDRCISGESKILNIETGLWVIDMLGVCRVEEKC